MQATYGCATLFARLRRLFRGVSRLMNVRLGRRESGLCPLVPSRSPSNHRGRPSRVLLAQPPEQLREAGLQDVGDLAGGVCRDVTPDAFGRFRAWKAIPVST